MPFQERSYRFLPVVLITSLTQAALAWIMAIWSLVYAPAPMLAAAVVGALLLKNEERYASLLGAMAGLVGGALAEIAYHGVRMKKVVSWIQLTPWEQVLLAAAETVLYAALLSFFMGFFSGLFRKSLFTGHDK